MQPRRRLCFEPRPFIQIQNASPLCVKSQNSEILVLRCGGVWIFSVVAASRPSETHQLHCKSENSETPEVPEFLDASSRQWQLHTRRYAAEWRTTLGHILQQLHLGRTVLVHCLSGKNRSPALRARVPKTSTNTKTAMHILGPAVVWMLAPLFGTCLAINSS